MQADSCSRHLSIYTVVPAYRVKFVLEPPLACLNVSVNQILGVHLLMCVLNLE